MKVDSDHKSKSDTNLNPPFKKPQIQILPATSQSKQKEMKAVPLISGLIDLNFSKACNISSKSRDPAPRSSRVK